MANIGAAEETECIVANFDTLGEIAASGIPKIRPTERLAYQLAPSAETLLKAKIRETFSVIGVLAITSWAIPILIETVQGGLSINMPLWVDMQNQKQLVSLGVFLIAGLLSYHRIQKAYSLGKNEKNGKNSLCQTNSEVY